MHIALIAPPWLPVPPPSYGGTEEVVDLLARGIAAAGHDVTLFCTGDSTCPVPRAWLLERAATGRMGDGGIELAHVIRAHDALRGADVVHDHTLCGPIYAQRHPDPPMATTAHGPFDPTLGEVYRAMGARAALVAISHHQAGTATTEVAAVIHHGLDLDRFPPSSGGGGYVAFLGRMSPEKGVDAAIRVARRAGVPLRIAAKQREPAEQAYFDEVVRPLLGPGVEYLGELGCADKVALLGGAEALLNPIAWPEPFGLVMVEALACGTPVVGTPRGSAPEIVDDGRTGFLRDDEAGLAAALLGVGGLDRARCRAAAEQRFSAARMVREHLALYERLLGATAGPSCDPRSPVG